MVLAAARDWAIIILAVFLLLQTVMLTMVCFALWRTVVSLKRKMEPILDDTKKTTGNVAGVTTIVADTVIKPLAKMWGFTVGVRKAMSFIARFTFRRGKGDNK